MDEYLVPAGFGEDEFTEKKSRFIGSVWRCETEEEALDKIREMNEKYRGAAHNCYAYIIRENNIMRFSDNGEPQGTAGMPMLEVLRRENVTNVLCVATRYFGGILLGAGGLVRAYTKTAKIGLDAAGIALMRRWTHLLIEAPYNWQERVKLKIEELGGVIDNIDYGSAVLFDAWCPAKEVDNFCAQILDHTNGAVSPVPMEDKFMGVRIK